MRKSMITVFCACLLMGVLGGCGNNSNISDTASDSTMTEGSQTEETQTKEITENTETGSQEVTTQNPETEEPTETQKPIESETEEPTETQKPTESESQEPTESQKPTETQKPTESESQKPTESQKPSETQKPTESESQEPTEPETQEPETQEPEVQYEEYRLSTQTYDYARQVSEKYYLVQKGDYYGLVDFNGKEIVPIKYEEYALVAEDEIEFRYNDFFYNEETGEEEEQAYVYNLKTGKLVCKYWSLSSAGITEEPYETIIVDGVEHAFWIGYIPEVGGYSNGFQYSSYQNGLIMEYHEVAETWDFNDVIYDWNEYGYRRVVTFKNASTGKVIYSGYTDSYNRKDGHDGMVVAEFSADVSESKAVMLEYSIKENKYYLVTIDLNGYQKHEIKDTSIFDSNIGYRDGWLKMPLTATMLNTDTMDIVSMPLKKETAQSWFVGRDEYYAVSTDEGDNKIYTIYKGTKVMSTGYTIVYFAEKYMICSKPSGQDVFIDYKGNELFTVKDYGQFLNGQTIIYDGTGVYYVDDTLAKISDYIYKGTVENCQSGTILVDGKYYLIGKK